jgi:5-(carboxyamino)imidazole ribonucleotide mutase
MAIGSAGASNAALMALEILALNDQKLAQNLEAWRNQLSSSIPDEPQN